MENVSKYELIHIDTTNKSLLQMKKEKQQMFLVKNRNGNYELLNELQYEKRLIYGS